jgi:tetratricopeptide (TPR) repeat protein
MSKKSKSKKPNAPATPEEPATGHPGKSRIYNKPFIHIFLIAVIGVLAYSNTFSVPFMFDDKAPNGQIEDNLMIRDLGNFSRVLKGHDFGSTEGYIFVPRRFMGYLSFALNYEIHGLSVAGYHIVNIAIHIANALLVYFLVLLTFKTPFMAENRGQETEGGKQENLIALFSSLLFVSHPIQTESVTYIVQRFASLATMFYLLSLVMYVKGRLLSLPRLSSACCLLSSVLFALLAMLTKEISFTLPLMVLLYELIFFRHTFKRSLLLSLIAGVIVISSSVLVLGANGKSLGDMLSDLSVKTRLETDISRWDYLMTQTRVMTTYVRLLLLPTDQNLDYDYPVFHSFFDPRVVLSFTFLSLLFATGVYSATGNRLNAKGNLFLRFTVHDSRLLGFGILWFFVTLSVESSIIPLGDVIFEHRMYLPSIGAFIVITQVMFIVIARGTPRFFSYASACLLSIVVIFSIATYKRNMVWQNEMTMWEDIVSKSPQKARALNNLAAINIDRHRPEAALDYLKRALAVDPHYMDAYRNLASAYMNLGAYNEALAAYRKILEYEPNNAGVLSSAATAHIKTGNYEAARDAALKALSINPDFPAAYDNLGTAYRKLGKYDDALKAVNQALRIRPNFAQAHNNLGLTYVVVKRFDEAAAAFKRSLELDPSYTAAYSNLGGLYIVQKNYAAAIEILKRAVEVDQNDIDAHVNLAVAYALKGDRNSAMEQYAALNKISLPDAERLLGIIGKIK